MVQACHAAQESGAKFGCPDSCHLVLCSVENTFELEKISYVCQENDIKFVTFYEPDDQMGDTAICTEPIWGEKRKAFRKFNTWKPVV
jgi:hypothetical protein